MSLLNTQLKPFKTQGFHKGQVVDVTEKDTSGKWSVFFFYPADFTFVCPTELEDLADHHEEFKKLGVDIYSVSTDTHFSHKAWHDSSEAIGKINYMMLGDQNHTLSKNFEVLQDNGLAQRGTFVVDDKGVVQSIEISAEGVGRSAPELLRKVKALQYIAKHPNEVCPAKWKEGEKTLKPSLDLVGKI